jgi:ubiquinone/menaquinone biosynthesis C-methylase UbiE
MSKLFDSLPDTYDNWFTTPIGKLVKESELRLVLSLLNPGPGELILDAGCGTGVFTSNIVESGSWVIGLDVSRPMLKKAICKIKHKFSCVCADMLHLPFHDNAFDKSISITAIEFIKEARQALGELERVTKPGGAIVVATLNILSPWALKRKKHAEKTGGIFADAIFRSPDEVAGLIASDCITRTAIHFPDDSDPKQAVEIEESGNTAGLDSGAFVAAAWIKR